VLIGRKKAESLVPKATALATAAATSTLEQAAAAQGWKSGRRSYSRDRSSWRGWDASTQQSVPHSHYLSVSSASRP
jgi:hypothetical protein